MSPILEEIRRAIEALPQAMRVRHEPQPAGARESAVATTEALGELTVAIQKLNGLLDRGGINVGVGRPPTDAVKGPGFPSLEAMWRRVDSVVVPTERDSQGKIDTELTRAHLLWTNEDLIQRYGASSGAGQNGDAIQL